MDHRPLRPDGPPPAVAGPGQTVKNAFIGELIGPLAGRHFLELGCRSARHLLQAESREASRVLGLCDHPDDLEITRQELAEAGRDRRCAVVFGQPLAVPPEPGRFDVILLDEVLGRLDDDDAILAAAARALRPGGRLVLSVHNTFALPGLIPTRRPADATPPRPRTYSPSVLRGKLERAGFRCPDWRAAHLLPRSGPGLLRPTHAWPRPAPLDWIDRTLGRVRPGNRIGRLIVVRAVTPNWAAIPLSSRTEFPLPALGRR